MSDESAALDVTRLLVRWRSGDETALERLVPLVYDELRRVARARLRAERVGHTLQPTALVHEAFIRFAAAFRMPIESRTRFFALAARLMRQVLVDHARRRVAHKRGGAVTLVGLEAVSSVNAGSREQDLVDTLALDEALTKLATFDKRCCQVVEMRFFAGLSIDETVRRSRFPAPLWNATGRLPRRGYLSSCQAKGRERMVADQHTHGQCKYLRYSEYTYDSVTAHERQSSKRLHEQPASGECSWTTLNVRLGWWNAARAASTSD